MKARINLLGGKLFDFIPHCLGLYDSGVKELDIHAFGGNASQALVLAQMLNQINGKAKKYNHNAKIYESKTKYSPLNSISASVEYGKNHKLSGKTTIEDVDLLNSNKFVDFSVYHLLFSHVLHTKKEIKISIDVGYVGNKKMVDLLIIKEDQKVKGQINIDVLLKYPAFSERSNDRRRYDRLKKFHNRLIDTLYRTGYLLPNDWEEIGLKLSAYDDIIIGLDTNLLSDSFISSSLLPILSVIERQPCIQTPNWMLLVIPQMVIYELETAANKKEDKGGHFIHSGRRGFRALQEIMELRKNFDYKGLSVVNAGSTDVMLDVNALLKSMNDNLLALVNAQNGRARGRRTPKGSSADMLIRSQFKTFVEGLNFKKGSYFLTSDKVNAAMYTSSGSEALYISKPYRIENSFIQPPELIPRVRRTIPLGTLLYELAVDFGKLTVHIGDNSIVKLDCDLRGQSLVPWIKKQLRIPDIKDFRDLIEQYNGSLNLVEVKKFYNEISNQLENIDWMTDDDIDYELM